MQNTMRIISNWKTKNRRLNKGLSHVSSHYSIRILTGTDILGRRSIVRDRRRRTNSKDNNCITSWISYPIMLILQIWKSMILQILWEGSHNLSTCPLNVGTQIEPLKALRSWSQSLKEWKVSTINVYYVLRNIIRTLNGRISLTMRLLIIFAHSYSK